MVKTIKQHWVITLVVAVGIMAILAAGYAVTGGAAQNLYHTSEENVTVKSNSALGNNTYTASYGGSQGVVRWKYVIRADDTCEGSIFSNGGSGVGNSSAIIHGSVAFTPTNQQIADYNGQYICFNVLLNDDTWAQGGAQLNLTTPSDGQQTAVSLPDNWDELTMEEKIALNPYGCSDPTLIRADNGQCIIESSVIAGSFPYPGSFEPGSSAELYAYLAGYLHGAEDDNEGIYWQNMYSEFEKFVRVSNAESIACYNGGNDAWTNLYETVVNDSDNEHSIPDRLHDYIIEGFGPDASTLTSEDGYRIALKHQVISQSAGGFDEETGEAVLSIFTMCKYDVISFTQ